MNKPTTVEDALKQFRDARLAKADDTIEATRARFHAAFAMASLLADPNEANKVRQAAVDETFKGVENVDKLVNEAVGTLSVENIRKPLGG